MRMLLGITCLALLAASYLYIRERLDDPPATLIEFDLALIRGKSLEESLKIENESPVVTFRRLSECELEATRRWNVTKSEEAQGRLSVWKSGIGTEQYEKYVASRPERGWRCEHRGVWW